MSDQQDRADEAKPDVETEEPDIADEEELDIEIERVAPKRAGGCGAWGWIIVIIIVAVIAIIGGVRYRERLAEEATKAKELRDTGYRAQEGTINENVKKAAQTAAEGAISEALEQLSAAEEKWGQMAAGANSAGDTDQAQYAAMRKGALAKVLGELDADRKRAAELAAEAAKLQEQLDARNKRRDALNSRVRDRILELAGEGEEPVAEPVEM